MLQSCVDLILMSVEFIQKVQAHPNRDYFLKSKSFFHKMNLLVVYLAAVFLKCVNLKILNND